VPGGGGPAVGEPLGEMPRGQLGSVVRQHEDDLTASLVRQRAEDSLDLGGRRPPPGSASGRSHMLGDGHIISLDANYRHGVVWGYRAWPYRRAGRSLVGRTNGSWARAARRRGISAVVVGVMALLIVLPTVSVLLFRSPGDEPAQVDRGVTLPVGAASSCQDLAADPFFSGQAMAMLETTPGVGQLACVLDLSGARAPLDALGLQTDCPVGLSTIVAFTRDSGSWFVDLDGTQSLNADQGSCSVAPK